MTSNSSPEVQDDGCDVHGVVQSAGDVADLDTSTDDVRCKVGPIRHDPVDKKEPDGEQYRVHIAYASRAVIVPSELTASQFELQAEQLAEREQIKGQQKLDVADEEQLSEDDVEPDEPFLGYADLTAGEVVERIEACDDSDEGLVSAIEAYEEANGSRAEILNAVKNWRDNGQ